MNQDTPKRNKQTEKYEDVVAPGIDEEDSFGEDATQSEIKRGESTKVTRMIYDEYDPREP